MLDMSLATLNDHGRCGRDETVPNEVIIFNSQRAICKGEPILRSTWVNNCNIRKQVERK